MYLPQARSPLFQTRKVKRRLVATRDEDATAVVLHRMNADDSLE